MAKKKVRSLWKGPALDGITFSLLNKFLVCRERFRLHVVEGLRIKDSFNHRLEYGQMWHTMEETLAQGKKDSDILQALNAYCRSLTERYSTAQDQIVHWRNVAREQFPIYAAYWSLHPDVKNQTPLAQEQTFKVPYFLPSGRMVTLRGKWDSVDLVGKGRSTGIYLQENKTKGDIKEQQLVEQLSNDLQTMIYLVALREDMLTNPQGKDWGDPSRRLKGVRYNVVRRPLAGGKHSIRQRKNETPEEFYQRLAGIIESHADFFFMRWKVEVSAKDIERFQLQVLNPILEQLCDWWNWIRGGKDPWRKGNQVHWKAPFGVYDPFQEGRGTELDEYLLTGSKVGLETATTLFPELES